jgi:LysR family transcriptional regulator, glycine cleavage system transcriptional activator
MKVAEPVMTRRRSMPGPRPRSAQPGVAAATFTTSQLLALQAFDVAVRLGSFKAAAHRLNLTLSAVSHRIKNLERALGVKLFVRGHRAVHPTLEGRSLAAATGRAFAELVRGVPPAGSRSGRQRLRLKVFPLFASAWLIPRLAGFATKYPHIDLVLETSSRIVNFDVESFDAGISVRDIVPDKLKALHLVEVRSTPIATPALVRRLKLRAPSDLERTTLIGVASFPAAWSRWFKQAGIPDLKPQRTITVDGFVEAIQAAEQGAGVALGMNLFIGERERQGVICRPFNIESPAGSYWLLQAPGAARNRALQTFKRWLIDELPELRSSVGAERAA